MNVARPTSFSASNRPASATSDAGAAALWHAAWALGVGLGAALMLIVLGSAPRPALTALGCGFVPGVVGWLLRPARGHGVYVMMVWAGACAFAMAFTGGVSGPLAAWGLAPLLAAAALGGLWIDGATLSFAAFTGVALIEAAGKAGPVPTGPVALWLGIIGLGTTLAGAAAAMTALTARTRAIVDAAVASPAQPDALVQAGLAEANTARAAAEADAHAKVRFLANMSHELRTPLNAIMGFSDIMRSRLFGDMPAKYGEYAELIHESGRHLLDLINDVLDMSKIEADRYELQTEVFDVREAVNAALRILRIQADASGVSLRAVLPPADLEVDADRRAIKQIVINLVSNALKFTPAYGAVTVSVHVAAHALEIVVADTGVGIAPEDVARLGRPFEQAGAADARSAGTGLGLSLVAAFARLHGGEMTIESQLGDGTAVTVRLPVLVGERGAAAPAAELHQAPLR